jgi:holo-[acyl-carrier protein] synthase
MSDAVRGEATVVVAITEAERAEAEGAFTPGERAYARSKSDPLRRLAARLAAKQAALEALGGGLALQDFEVVRAPAGPPRLELSARGRARLAALGAERVLVSITHGREHAAAAVLVLARGGR